MRSKPAPAPKSTIFISYRRDDTAGHARHLYSLLDKKFPGRVFMDIDTIPPGRDFIDAIDDAIGKSKALVVLIGRDWLSLTGPAGDGVWTTPKTMSTPRLRRRLSSTS